MEKHSFTTIANNGESSQYTNTCFWISISDFLKYVKGINLNSDTIRNFAKFPGEHDDFFDFFNKEHRQSAQYLCNQLGIGIDFHYVNTQKTLNSITNAWLSPCIVNINGELDNNDRVAIASYGNHFEFIISQTNKLPAKILLKTDVTNDKKIINHYEPFEAEKSLDNIDTNLSSGDTNYIIDYLNKEIVFYKLLIETHNKEIDFMFNESNKILTLVVELKNRIKLIYKESNFFDDNIAKITTCELSAKSKGVPSFKYKKIRNELISNKLKYNNLIPRLNNEITIKTEKYKHLVDSIDSVKITIDKYTLTQQEYTKMIEVLKSNRN